jgi:hypothetical protein
MSRTREVPRWRQRKPSPGPPVILNGRQARRFAREVGASIAAGPGAPLTGRVIPPHRGVTGSKVMARTGAFRFRMHLVPFEWLAAVLAVGLGSHLGHAFRFAVITGIVAAVAIVALSRHLSSFARGAALAWAALTALWLPLLAAFGWSRPWPAILFGSWACVLVPWVVRYKWRHEEIKVPDVTDYETWNLLAAERKWNAHLGTREDLPGGGRRYPLQCDGIKTVTSNILSASENVAGAWHKPMTEAFAERDQHGVTSRGYFTVLGRDTLQKVREWNGAGIDPQTGMAMVGRYADGSPAHLKFYTPRYGTRHALISGTTGSGKSELLSLLTFIAISSGFIVPVILDPQEGQSLPFWRDRVSYAAGVDECMAMLDGLHAGMLDRSSYLSALRWDDEGIPMRGMPFFDHDLTGLPIPLIIFDEAHMLLKGDTKQSRAIVEKTVEIGRLGRKTGTALWLATHLPSLSELGGEQALRDMLRGGNVVSMRTANRVAAGMLGLEKDPSEIPSYFADGKETYGLGYVAGPDNRPDAPMRTDLVPKAMRRKVPAVPALDDRFAEAMERAMDRRRAASVPVPSGLGQPAPASFTVVPPAADDGPAGRTAADAILSVLAEAGREMSRGEIEVGMRELAKAWGRDKPWVMRSVSLALEKLTASGEVEKPQGNLYRLPRPSLHVVGPTSHI